MNKVLLTTLAFAFSASICASESTSTKKQTDPSIFKKVAQVQVLNAKEMTQTQAGAICFSVTSSAGGLRQICY